MKSVLKNNIYTLHELQFIVIGKLRALGFAEASEKSLQENETHCSLYLDVIQMELLNIDALRIKYQEVLDQLAK